MFGFVRKKTIEKKIDARIAEVDRLKQYYTKSAYTSLQANFKGLKRDFGIKP